MRKTRLKRKRRSTTNNLTQVTKNGDLHPDDVSRIIQSCKDAGVRELSFRGLSLKFDAPSLTPSQMNATVDTVSLKSKRKLQDVAARRALELDEVRYRQDQIELMKIEDPEQYEDLVLKGELLDTKEDEDI